MHALLLCAYFSVS